MLPLILSFFLVGVGTAYPHHDFAKTLAVSNDNVTIEAFCSSKQFGGSGGGSFSDAQYQSSGHINNFVIYAGTYVDGVQLKYGGTTAPRRGGAGGAKHDIRIVEPIIKVFGRSGKYIDQLGFESNVGWIYGPYGGKGGGSFEYQHCPTCRLRYISGHAGKWLDGLRFHFDCSAMNV